MSHLARFGYVSAALIAGALGVALVSGIPGPWALAGGAPPSTHTHLGVPWHDIVMLRGIVDESATVWRFRRLHADGKVDAGEFVVPPGRVLVVTDFEASHQDAPEGSTWRYSILIDSDLPQDFELEALAAAHATGTSSAGGAGGASWSGTTGFAVAPLGRVKCRLRNVSNPGVASATFDPPTIRGYLVDETTPVPPEPETGSSGGGAGGGRPEDPSGGGGGGGRGGRGGR